MGKFLILGAVAALTSVCSAAPCVSGSLATYISLGAGGCTIGTNNLFDFQVLTGITGATQFLPGNVLLAPLGGAFDPGLSASVTGSASSRSILESVFTYKISGNAYTGSSLALSNASETGDGAVTGLENFCAGGTFGSSGLTGCTGLAGTLATVDGVQNQDSRNFSSALLLSVTNDLTIDSGLAGTARGGTLTNRFTAVSAVPEPATAALGLIGLGLAVAAGRILKH